MTDRRRDDRVQIGLDCILYVDGMDDLEATVRDISEIGIAFEMNYTEELYKQLKDTKSLEFAYIDNFYFLDKPMEMILQANCEVVRISKEKENIVIGCKLNADREIKHYVTQKKVNKFMETINRERFYRE